MTDTRVTNSTPAPPSDETGAGAVQPVSFEAAMSELEALVQAMESGSMSLEQSLDAYRRGAALVASCRQSLTDARQQVRILEAELLKVFDAADPQGDDE